MKNKKEYGKMPSMQPSFTIINDKGVQGILVLSLSKKEIEDIVDFIELSSPDSQRESEERIGEKSAFVPMKNVHAMVRRSSKSRRR